MTTEALLSAEFKLMPWEHQAREFELSAEMPARALLWQMRTGKTKVVIDTAFHLFGKGDIASLVIFAPNGVHKNWVRRELPAHAWGPYNALAWDTETAGLAGKGPGWRKRHVEFWESVKYLLKSNRLAVFTFNSESMTRPDVKKLIARIHRRGRFMAVWDEASDFRTPGSKRTKTARAIAQKAAYRRILEGTTAHNSPLHVFSQYELLQKGALGFTTYDDFKEQYANFVKRKRKDGREYPVLDPDNPFKNMDELQNSIAKYSSVVLRSDCEDLPDLIRERRLIPLNAEQVRLYEGLRTQAIIDFEGGLIDIGDNAPRFIKFQQIVSGFLKDTNGAVYEIPGATSRIDALRDEVMSTSDNVIIWCAFQYEMDRVADRLKLDSIPFVEYHGRVSDKDRASALTRFQSKGADRARVLIGHPQSAGRGLELSAAGVIIWYSHTFSAIFREQANERATKMHGENVRVVDFVAPGIDEYILANVDAKIDVADRLAGTGLKAALEAIKL